MTGVQALPRSVVRVSQRGSLGTGFFVLPGLVLTCEHVCPTEPSRDAIQVEWQGRHLTVTDVIRPPQPETPDLLLIEVAERDHPLAPVGSAEDLLAAFYAFGYQFTDRQYDGYSTSGKLAGPAWDRKLATPRQLIVLQSAAVSSGLSGGPAYSLADRRVVGVVVRQNPDGGGYAVPIQEVEQLRPGLLEENAQLTGTVTLGPYLEQLAREHSYVTLADLQRDLRLDQIYVTLTLASVAVTGARQGLDSTGRPTDVGPSAKIDFQRDQGSPQRQHRQPEVPLGEVLAQPAAVVLGEPGVGKTTLIRHLLIRTCRGELFPGRVPVFIKLAALGREPGAVRAYLRGVHPQAADIIERETDRGQAVYFLDGLDEMPRADQQAVAAEVVRLAAQRNHVFVTCRTASFPSGILPTAFRVFECVGFNRSQRRRFLQHWFEDDPTLGHDLSLQVEARPAISGFGRSPLLLSLLAMLSERQGGANLPAHRAELYGRLVDELLRRRDGEAYGLTLQRRAKERLLQHLALTFMRRKREALSTDETLDLVEEFQASDSGRHLRAADPEEVLAAIVKRDGILAGDNRGGLRFIHRSFQEYLAASALLRLGHAGRAEIASHVGNPLWEEVVRLFASQLPSADADQFLAELFAVAGGGPLARHDRLLLAARCAAEADVSPATLAGLLRALVELAIESDLSAMSTEGSFALAALCTTRPGLLSHAHDLVTNRDGGFGSHRAFHRFVALLGLVPTEESGRYLMGLLAGLCVEETMAQLGDEESWVRMVVAVLKAVGQNGRTAGEDLLTHLHSPYSSIAASAAAALEQVRPLAEESIELCWRSPREVRGLALPALLRAAEPQRVRAALRRLYVTEPDPLLQLSLRALADPEQVEADHDFVSALLADCADQVSLGNLLSLSSLMAYLSSSRTLLDYVTDAAQPHRVRSAAVQSLLERDPAAAAEVVDQLLTLGDHDLVTVAVSALIRTGNSTAHSLLTRRASEHPYLVDRCLDLFVAVPSAVAVPWLRPLVASYPETDPRTIRVVLALAAAGDPVAVPPLTRYLKGHDERFRTAAYRALAQMAVPEAAPLIIERLRREVDVTVVTTGILALGDLSDDASAAMLLSCLDPTAWPAAWPARMLELRKGEQRSSDRRLVAATIGVGSRGVTAALPRLWQLTSDSSESPEVRETAYAALRTLAWLAEPRDVVETG
ncbi:HEAT repeat domain-containing protein [Micromonospora tarensis]|uniref:HEAT repeat domain-containing protein n=1 Tax=Micromonospora tarensis TaxID=2806100 RepID=A0ABS1YE12_9ACTN|nr:HEAT repeat domain-containing protein [Micromonospora tarensis]MBM0275489.1 HEAT repeat domain-containing protein [Micromonospora tarensis]